jgi:hypothetical protein
VIAGGYFFTAAGNQIAYTITARNTGNTLLDAVMLANAQDTRTCNLGTLSPDNGTPLLDAVCGAANDVPLLYTVTQADVDRGWVDITGTGSARGPSWSGGQTYTDEDVVTVVALQSPAMEVRLIAEPPTLPFPGEHF